MLELYGHGNREPSITSFQATLAQILDGFERVCIVIDALDECQDREELLEWITEIVSQKAGRVRLAVTGRPEREIEDALLDLGACCVDVAMESSNHDIAAFLDRELATDRKFKKWDVAVRDEIQSVLIKGAEGMYVTAHS